MEIYTIEDDKVNYNNIVMQKAREFSFENRDYIQFLNYKEKKYLIMEKISNNQCIEILDKDLKRRVVENNFKVDDGIIE